MFTRFSSALALLACIFGLHVGSVSAYDLEKLVNQADGIRANAQSIVGDAAKPVDDVRMAEGRANAQRIIDAMSSNEEVAKLFTPPSSASKTPRTLFFVSMSLGESELDDILYTAANTPSSAVIFRGLLNPDSFKASILEIQQLAGRYPGTDGNLANVTLDPTLFKRFGVTTVPTIVILDEESRQLPTTATKDDLFALASVDGMNNPEWLERQIAQGKRGYLGVRGPVLEIAEPDLIETIKQRMAKIDWDDKKRKAAERFWNKQQWAPLPRTDVSQVRYFNPTVQITRDVTTDTGEVIWPAGAHINPLGMQPFNDAVVVFNPNDPMQVERVLRASPSLKAAVQNVTYIITELDTTTDGWKAYQSITNTLDAPVFKLTPDVQSRFGLTEVPTVITADNSAYHFVIQTLGADS